MSSSTFSKFGQTYVSYGSYHNNIVNKLIHIVCVPIITATLFCALSYIPLQVTYKGYTLGVAEVTLALVVLYYISINIWFAICMSLLAVGVAFGWKRFFEGVNPQSFFLWVIGLHVLAWIFQFIGHGVFQKRKPALLDNLTQILNAPLFVVVQILSMIGLGSKQMHEWDKQIQKNVQAFRKKNHSS